MKYNKLYTRDFIKKDIIQEINTNYLKKVLKHAYLNTRFSTFPYIILNMNSKQSIKKFKEGNCITLSMYIKDYLKKRGIKSFLIPATIPYFIQHPDLLEVSHVALAVSKNNNLTYILDCAFYFIDPLNICHKQINNKELRLMNFGNNNIDIIDSKNEILEKRLVYNEYQSVPKGIRICNCIDRNNKKSKWSYILREILNPDKSITDFFIRNNPFFLTTGYKNGRCIKDIEVNMYNNKYIVINKEGKYIYKGNIDEANSSQMKIIKHILSKYL